MNVGLYLNFNVGLYQVKVKGSGGTVRSLVTGSHIADFHVFEDGASVWGQGASMLPENVQWNIVQRIARAVV